MPKVLLSKGKERAKEKIKAGQKANAAKPAKFSINDTQVRYASGKPVVAAAIKKAAAPVKKVEPKKPAPKKTVTVVNAKGKTIYDPKARTITTYDKKGKTVIDKNYGFKTTYNKKGETTVYKDGSKQTLNKKGETWKDDQHTAVRNKKGYTYVDSSGNKNVKNKKGETWYWADGRKEVTNKQGQTKYDKTGKIIKPVVNKVPAKTVSQLWQEKTGTSWSEAKKQGLTDGSAAANIALMKKLKSGEISKSSLSKPKTEATPTPVTTTPTPTPTPKPTPYAGSGIGAMERSEREFEEQGFRRGGSVRKMRKGGIVKRRK